MKINKHFDDRTKTLKVGFETDFFSEQDLEEAKQDLIAAGALETSLNEEVDEALFENSYLDECEDCENKEDAYGSEEELDEDNFYIPEESEYVTAEEVAFDESDVLEYDCQTKTWTLGEYKKKETKGR
jgi:hypothetical protein